MAWHVVEVKTMTLAAQWCCNLKCIKSCFALGKGSSATVTCSIILLRCIAYAQLKVLLAMFLSQIYNYRYRCSSQIQIQIHLAKATALYFDPKYHQ